jgi:uncharacterized protein involved in cysteine biosynthesis
MEFEEEGLEIDAAVRKPSGPDQARAAPEATARPGVLRRGGEGAWHVFSGLWLLLTRPFLWPLAILPAVMAALGLVFGLLLGAFALRGAESALLPEPGKLSPALAVMLTVTLWVSVLATGMILGLGLALLLAGPMLDRLSQHVEMIRGQNAQRIEMGLTWEIAQSLRGRLRLLAAAPGILLIGLVPLVGPVVSFLWSSHVLALQETDGPLARRGLPSRARRAWHRRYRAESLGFGMAGLAFLLVPVANFLLAPVLTVGATLLVLEFEEGPPAPL